MICTYSEFMKLGSLRTSNPKIRNAYLRFNIRRPYPRFERGQLVLICEECGEASYTFNKSQKYCNNNCRNLARIRFLNIDLTLKKRFENFNFEFGQPTTKKPTGIIHKYCEHCGKIFTSYAHHVRQGRNLFCSKSCAKHYSCLKPLTYFCNNCKEEFKAISAINASFCSIECENSYKVLNQTPQIPPRILKDQKVNGEIEKYNFITIQNIKESIKNEFAKKSSAKKFNAQNAKESLKNQSGICKIPFTTCKMPEKKQKMHFLTFFR